MPFAHRGQAVQTFIEQQVGIFFDVFPRGEHAWLEVGQVEVLVVICRFGIAVHIVTALAHAGVAVVLEHFFDLVEVVGFRAEVAERMIAGLGCLGRSGAERHAIQAVQAVAFDDGGADVFAAEDVLKRALDGGGAGAGRAGDSDNGVLTGHMPLS